MSRTLSLLFTYIYKWLNINEQWQIGRGLPHPPSQPPPRGSHENSCVYCVQIWKIEPRDREHNEAALELPHQVGLFICPIFFTFFRGRCRRSCAQFTGLDLMFVLFPDALSRPCTHSYLSKKSQLPRPFSPPFSPANFPLFQLSL